MRSSFHSSFSRAAFIFTAIGIAACSGTSGGGLAEDAGGGSNTSEDGGTASGDDASSSDDATATADDASAAVDSAPAKSCKGKPFACTLLTSAECATVAGCTSSSTCGGVPTECGFIFSSFGCGSQPGCFWDSSSNYCGGEAFECTSNGSADACAFEMGCTWSAPTCSGTVTSTCASQTETTCTPLPGCSWE